MLVTTAERDLWLRAVTASRGVALSENSDSQPRRGVGPQRQPQQQRFRPLFLDPGPASRPRAFELGTQARAHSPTLRFVCTKESAPRRASRASPGSTHARTPEPFQDHIQDIAWNGGDADEEGKGFFSKRRSSPSTECGTATFVSVQCETLLFLPSRCHAAPRGAAQTTQTLHTKQKQMHWKSRADASKGKCKTVPHRSAQCLFKALEQTSGRSG
jgi:hypothetical protein